MASAATFSRLENATTPRDLFRIAQAFVDQFISSYAQPPAVIVLDLDHAEDAGHGQQEHSFANIITATTVISRCSSSRAFRAS